MNFYIYSEHNYLRSNFVVFTIVMEGTDLSIFDEVGDKDRRNQDDEDTLDQLEWELASQSGRITGRIF